MINSDPNQPFAKIPFKSCHGTTIEHNLVSIRLGVEWSDTGDNPHLVMHITNKVPATPLFRPNQAPPGHHANTRNYDNQMHDHFEPSYHHLQQQQQQQQQQRHQLRSSQQQHYFCPSQHPLPILCHSLPNTNTASFNSTRDHNDMSLTQETGLCNRISAQQQQQQLTTTIVHTVVANPLNHVPPNTPYKLIPNAVVSPSQNNHQLLSYDLNDDFGIQQMSPSNAACSVVINPNQNPMNTVYHVPSAMNSVPSNKRRIICVCTNPPQAHSSDCPVRSLHDSSTSNINYTNEDIFGPHSDSIMPTRTVETSPMDSCPLLSINDRINTTMAPCFQDTNLQESTIAVSNMNVPYSQSPTLQSILSNLPPLNIESNVQQQPMNFSRPTINNSSANCPLTSSNAIKTKESGTINPHPRRKGVTKRLQMTNQDQRLISKPIVSIEPTQPMQINTNTTMLQTEIDNIIYQTRLLSPKEQHRPQSGPSCSNDFQIEKPNSPHDFVLGLTNHSEKSETQDIDSLKSMVRSPVELDLLVPENLSQRTVSLEEVTQVIEEVSKGQGIVIFHKTSGSHRIKRLKGCSLKSQFPDAGRAHAASKIVSLPTTGPQQQQLTHIPVESNPIHVDDSPWTPPKTNSPVAEQHNLNQTSPRQSLINNDRSPNSLDINVYEQDPSTRPCSLNTIQDALQSFPYVDSSVITPVTPQSDFANNPLPWSDAPSNIFSCSESTPGIPKVSEVDQSIPPPWNENNSSFNINDGHHTDSNTHKLDLNLDEFLSTLEDSLEPFTPLAIPPSMTCASLTSGMAISGSNDSSNSTPQNQDAVYRDFFLAPLSELDKQVVQSDSNQALLSQTEVSVNLKQESKVR